MEQEIPGISKFPESLDNLERLTEIFETSFRKISVPFDFAPEFPEILVEWSAPRRTKDDSVFQDFVAELVSRLKGKLGLLLKASSSAAFFWGGGRGRHSPI